MCIRDSLFAVASVVGVLLIRDAASTLTSSWKAPWRCKTVLPSKMCIRDRVYASDRVLREEPRVTYVLSALFGHFLDNPPEACCCGDTALAALDHISGMTDRYALAFFERTILPSPWP